MKIKLPWVEEIDTEKLPENLEEIVIKSFYEFTRLTAKEYRDTDKLSYIDSLRSGLYGNKESDVAVEDIVKDYVSYHWNEYGKIPENEDIFDSAFMATCYEAGFLPLKIPHIEFKKENEEIATTKAIAQVIKIVMNYGDVQND